MKSYKPRWLAYPLTAVIYLGVGIVGIIYPSLELPTMPIIFIIGGSAAALASIVYFVNIKNDNESRDDIAKYLNYLSNAIVLIGIIFFNTRAWKNEKINSRFLLFNFSFYHRYYVDMFFFTFNDSYNVCSVKI